MSLKHGGDRRCVADVTKHNVVTIVNVIGGKIYQLDIFPVTIGIFSELGADVFF